MLILGGNQLTGGYEVDNSLRFNEDSNDYLNTTFGTSTSTQKCTYSVWVKRSKLQDFGGQYLLVYNNDGNAIYFNGAGTGLGSNDQFVVYSGSNIQLYTNRLFRDTSAWYHIVVAVDTTQATASNRVKLYVNGVQETSFATETYPAQNFDFDTLFSSSSVHEIGRGSATGITEYFAGYMSEIVFIDGQQLDPTDLGEFDEDTGIWKPIDVSDLTFGNNGFYLPFQNSAALGQDDSGNGNNFTVNNLTSIDQTTDTPTNNSATMNILDNYYTAATFSEGNLKIVTQNGDNYAPKVSNFALSQGKWYAEVKYVSRSSGDNFSLIGIKSTQITNTNYLGENTNDYGLYSENGNYYQAGSATSYGTSYDQGDIIGIYLDLDNNKLYFAKYGTIMNSGTGISITDPASTDQGYYFFSAGDFGNSVEITYEWNFGSPTFSISSGNTDANGYGNFEYNPSAGTFDGVSKNFYAINTKNLAEYG